MDICSESTQHHNCVSTIDLETPAEKVRKLNVTW